MSEQNGYVYHRASLIIDELRALIAHYVFGDGIVYAFSADILVLRELKPYPEAADIPLRDEFGHVFSVKAEVRWKRAGEGFDVLVLTEQAIDELKDSALVLAVSAASPKHYIVLETPRDVKQRGQQWRLGYKEYRGSNQAVQFVRYTERIEERAP